MLVFSIVGALAGLTSLGSGCFVPVDLDREEPDAGPSARPVIIRAQPPEFAFPGPLVLDRNDTRRLTLEVDDTNLEDTIYLRLYVDYNREQSGNQPTPPWADCQAAPTGEPTRFVDCPTNSLCSPIATNDGSDHILEALASDRPFILDSDAQAEGQPAFRAVSDPARASTTLRSWVMRCILADDV